MVEHRGPDPQRYLIAQKRTDVPPEFMHDDAVQDLFTQLTALQVCCVVSPFPQQSSAHASAVQAEFRETHKTVDYLRSSTHSPADLRREIAQLDEERRQLVERIDDLREKTRGVVRLVVAPTMLFADLACSRLGLLSRRALRRSSRRPPTCVKNKRRRPSWLIGLQNSGRRFSMPRSGTLRRLDDSRKRVQRSVLHPSALYVIKRLHSLTALCSWCCNGDWQTKEDVSAEQLLAMVRQEADESQKHSATLAAAVHARRATHERLRRRLDRPRPTGSDVAALRDRIRELEASNTSVSTAVRQGRATPPTRCQLDQLMEMHVQPLDFRFPIPTPRAVMASWRSSVSSPCSSRASSEKRSWRLTRHSASSTNSKVRHTTTRKQGMA